jgi:prevent-host-death family protein
VREIRSSDAKAHLTQLLTAVEQGESFIITRHGRPIARLVPEAVDRRAEVRKVKEQIAAFRRMGPRLDVADIQSARHEGHKY